MKIRSPDPRQHPLIDPKYFTDPTDLPDLVAAVKLTREIFNQKAFDEFRGPEVIPGGHVKSDKGICETKTIIEFTEQNIISENFCHILKKLRIGFWMHVKLHIIHRALLKWEKRMIQWLL